MAELAEGARLLSECSLKRATEGSNPSLSASLIHEPTLKSPHLLLSRPFKDLTQRHGVESRNEIGK